MEGMLTASSSQALRLRARRSAVGRAIRGEAFVSMVQSWQGGRRASMGRVPTDRLPWGRGEYCKNPGIAEIPGWWRRMGDSNPRGLAPNTLSKRAP